MNTQNQITGLTVLTDGALLQTLDSLSSKENEATLEFLLHLGEVDRRKLFAPAGYSSMHDYCTRKLGYSEPAAFRRIACARALRQFPELSEKLLSRALSLTTLSMVAALLNPDNHDWVIAAICGRSRREVEEFVAGFRPRAREPREELKPYTLSGEEEKPGGIFAALERKLSMKSASAGEGTDANSAAFQAMPQVAAAAETASAAGPRYQVKFTISPETRRKLEEAKTLLSGKYPQGVRLEEVFEEALEQLLERRSPQRRLARRLGRKERAARETPAPATSLGSDACAGRHIPAAVRDEVQVRDGGRCSYVSPEGVRCNARHDLEAHHEVPFARGGESSPANIRVLCRCHNALEAERVYGAAFMAEKIARAGAPGQRLCKDGQAAPHRQASVAPG